MEENANLTGSLRYSNYGPRYNTTNNNSNNNGATNQTQSYPGHSLLLLTQQVNSSMLSDLEVFFCIEDKSYFLLFSP